MGNEEQIRRLEREIRELEKDKRKYEKLKTNLNISIDDLKNTKANLENSYNLFTKGYESDNNPTLKTKQTDLKKRLNEVNSMYNKIINVMIPESAKQINIKSEKIKSKKQEIEKLKKENNKS